MVWHHLVHWTARLLDRVSKTVVGNGLKSDVVS